MKTSLHVPAAHDKKRGKGSQRSFDSGANPLANQFKLGSSVGGNGGLLVDSCAQRYGHVGGFVALPLPRVHRQSLHVVNLRNLTLAAAVVETAAEPSSRVVVRALSLIPGRLSVLPNRTLPFR